jgi:NDP-sugar pyrophosphorylase family protein
MSEAPSPRTPIVILCGGQGTRFREQTERRPKPMIEVAGRPILWHIMHFYAGHGFKDFVLCLGYMGDVIKRYFLDFAALESTSPSTSPPPARSPTTSARRSTGASPASTPAPTR